MKFDDVGETNNKIVLVEDGVDGSEGERGDAVDDETEDRDATEGLADLQLSQLDVEALLR